MMFGKSPIELLSELFYEKQGRQSRIRIMFRGMGEVPKLPDRVDEALRHRSRTEKTGHFLEQAFGEDR
ncbi:MAG: hypothetical protein ACKO39_12165, partial [Chthoniobacterales bacterium]